MAGSITMLTLYTDRIKSTRMRHCSGTFVRLGIPKHHVQILLIRLRFIRARKSSIAQTSCKYLTILVSDKNIVITLQGGFLMISACILFCMVNVQNGKKRNISCK
ncbi:hypothetical protein SAMN02744035_03615 [Thalassobacter stenotrophicus DSM 16310]|uniref:Uncharacterized protein n=1 Tax=Thalassobacter stenotrophicus DSM 16310 TaxID=1123361 RepID=A0ABY1ILR2_9RHOB|nr:hypothetical protein SAMN02744035_03615 [Thalassobacter stenotrophicus DSM 16310]